MSPQQSDLTVAPDVLLETGTGSLSLAAGTNPDGTTASTGMLTILPGPLWRRKTQQMTPSLCARRTSPSQQAPMRPSSVPIARHPRQSPGLMVLPQLAFDASGNLYVANYGAVTYGTTVSVVAPGSVKPTSTLTGLGTPIGAGLRLARQPLRGQHGHEHSKRLRTGTPRLRLPRSQG